MSEETDNDRGRLEKAAEDLGEHFDSVRIFVTKHIHGKDSTTRSICAGYGNFPAQYGQVVEWVDHIKALTFKHATNEQEEE